MMAPASLYSSYGRYKADTDVVSEWLLTTATRCGFHRPDYYVQSSSAETSTPRPKGKARKVLRASQALLSKDAAKASQTRRIEIHEFVQMAQFVAKSTNPPVQVPASLFRTLTRAISTRKSHQAFYYRYHDRVEGVTPVCGHTHFIETLEAVLDILRAKMCGTTRPTSSQNDDHTTADPLSNMFAGLDVEEPPESNDTTSSGQPSFEATRVNVVVDGGDDFRRDEAFLASTLLCRDVHQLRNVVQETWKSYLDGKIDLVAASITANTAIDFCRKLQQEFDDKFPTENKIHDLVCLYCVFLQETNSQNNKSKNHVEFCSQTARRILCVFVQNIKDDSPNVMPAVIPAHVALYDTRCKNRSCMEDDEKLFIDFQLVMGVLPEFYALIHNLHCDSRFQAEHEIIRALRQIISRKQQSYWTTFAIQILLDIRHILRDKVFRGLQDLQRGGRLNISSIGKIVEFHKFTGMTKHSHNDVKLEELMDLVARWVERDNIRDLLDRENRMEDPSTVSHVTDFYLLERDPLWCGLLLYNFRMVAHEGAIITANSWTFILATSHLYNSLRQTNMLHCEWEDMESILSMHRAENLFVGNLPTSFVECMKRCALACGLPATHFARKSRPRRPQSSTGKVRKLRKLAPVSREFKKRFCDGDDRIDFGPMDLMNIFHKSGLLSTAESSTLLSGIIPANVLQLLPLCIHNEASELTFNHFEVHIACWKLLRRLHTLLRKDLLEWSTEVYRDDRNLPSVVLWLLTEAAEQEKLATAIGVSRHAALTPSMSKVVETFEDFGILEV
jgi:hypothetical protein